MTAAIDRVRSAPQWAVLTGTTIDEIRTEAIGREAAGYRGVLLPQVYAPQWAKLAVAAAFTTQLELASGITLGFARSPFETAMAALDLDRLSIGRFTLGLGSSLRSWNEDRFGVDYDRPVARLRELVGLLRRLMTTDDQTGIGRFDGEFWQLDLRDVPLPRPLRSTVPIGLAPLRARMLDLAAETADVIYGHPMWTPDWIAGPMNDALHRGLERSGRQRSDVRIIATVRVAITDDIERGRADAKLGIPFYAAHAQYDSYLADLGLATDARTLQELAARHVPAAELAAAVTDRMADALTLIGPADHIATQLAAMLDHVDALCLTPPPGVPAARAREYTDAITNQLGPRPIAP